MLLALANAPTRPLLAAVVTLTCGTTPVEELAEFPIDTEPLNGNIMIDDAAIPLDASPMADDTVTEDRVDEATA